MNIKIEEKLYMRFIFIYVLKLYYINDLINFIIDKSIPQKNS